MDVRKRPENQAPIVLNRTLEGPGDRRFLVEPPRGPLDLFNAPKFFRFLDGPEDEIADGTFGRGGHGAATGAPYLTGAGYRRIPMFAFFSA